MSGTMKPYIVRQGDYLAKLAVMHGFDADEVWNDPKNEELKQSRPDPNILAPGDILYIPEKKKPESLPITKGTENSYVATVPTVEVVLVFMDGDMPLANEPCVVQGLGDSDESVAPTTDGEGRLTLNVPVMTREVSVQFAQRRLAYVLRVGDMDPVAEPSGVKKRLYNLGYLPGYGDEDTDDDDDLLSLGVAALQARCGLNPTGEADDAARQALVDSHKS